MRPPPRWAHPPKGHPTRAVPRAAPHLHRGRRRGDPITLAPIFSDEVRATPLFRRLREQLTDNIEPRSSSTARRTSDGCQEIPDPRGLHRRHRPRHPLYRFLRGHAPLFIPRQSRFEHMHIWREAATAKPNACNFSFWKT